MLVPAGFPITVFNKGDFWVKNSGATPALYGQKVYANYADGRSTAAPTVTPNGATTSAGSIAAATSGFVASIVGNVLTVSALNSGTIYSGTTISGTDVANGTKIVQQLTSAEIDGSLGKTGTYAVSIPDQNVDPGTVIAGTYGVFTAGGNVVGVFGNGDTLTGAGITAVTTLTQQLTGPTGGVGTYAGDVNRRQCCGSHRSHQRRDQVDRAFICPTGRADENHFLAAGLNPFPSTSNQCAVKRRSVEENHNAIP
ncbi:hypothetical protein FJW04_23215 [Mesorhizobium sp. B2-7-3]|nr:hypothetical protein FJW04_23215 [Mesorhizobium sp. B2-7-3]